MLIKFIVRPGSPEVSIEAQRLNRLLEPDCLVPFQHRSASTREQVTSLNPHQALNPLIEPSTICFVLATVGMIAPGEEAIRAASCSQRSGALGAMLTAGLYEANSVDEQQFQWSSRGVIYVYIDVQLSSDCDDNRHLFHSCRL